MTTIRYFLWTVALLSTAVADDVRVEDRSPIPDRIGFNRDVRPILAENCYACHGPDSKTREADLRFDTKDGISVAVAPGSLEKSELWKRISHAGPKDRMPPARSGKKLTARETAVLRKWIEQGAEWQGHWAFIPPVKAPPPPVKNGAWIRTPIDAFILARLEKEGLGPSPEADPVTLLRRLSFDLTGLPPEREEVDEFLKDPVAGYEKAVDRLLASPHYGERMALMWLDLVRFADSRGYHADNPRNVGSFRDYVIEAFNRNMPFDRFTVEQLAGDLLPEPTQWQKVASGYNKLNLTTIEVGAQAKDYEAKSSADRVRNAAGVWMGVTLGCAECHDHKFDPFTTKDFYRFAAFFADIQEEAISDPDLGIYVPSDAQAGQYRKLEADLAALKKILETPTRELAAAQAPWEQRMKALSWSVLPPKSVKSKDGSELQVQPDGSVLVTGRSSGQDTHIFTSILPVKGARGLRLEALTHPSLPKSGPGRSISGNFVLTGLSVHSDGKPVAIHRPAADFSQDKFPIVSILDEGKKTVGWAVSPQLRQNHVAAVEFKAPFGLGGGTPITVVLQYRSDLPEHVIGRFRLSVSTDESPSDDVVLPPKIRAILGTPAEKRTEAEEKEIAAYYRTVAPLLSRARADCESVREAFEALQRNVRRSLVTVSGPPRTVRILPRGNWLDTTGEVVDPGVPAFMRPMETGDKRATRLDLAKWLASRDNPLTARVFVNRLWKLAFGVGLSRHLDDLGTQGEWPAHPELLDFLALQFVDDGWDVKMTVKRLVMSSAYRQSSRPTRELRERDPYNRLVGCQSRWRLDAESVRDNALAVSGLLVRKIGGDSVRPYQPRGYWSFLNFPTREWETDQGEEANRRGIYTWWQRTFMHPALMAFDAPRREECCAERDRSNHPQQALVLLNDPAYVEAARAFAERIVKEGGTSSADRLTWAFRRALSRPPSAQEAKVLADLQAKHRAQFAADPKAARQVLTTGQLKAPADLQAAELASWMSVARAILNLHETITRE